MTGCTEAQQMLTHNISCLANPSKLNQSADTWALKKTLYTIRPIVALISSCPLRYFSSILVQAAMVFYTESSTK